jgi:type III secretion system YscD/HrpQ family protein
MAGILIGEEGLLSGLILRLEGKEEWVLGRDPDEVDLVLEDPMVSRRHAICRLTPEGYLLENLSAVNPATQNGKVITEAVLLREGDIIQIGSTFFRFSEKELVPPIPPEEELALPEEPEELASLHLDLTSLTRWLLKVVSGPNAGAEFGLQKGTVYVIGKDPNLCDIVFQDLSVSRQHARLTITDAEEVFIEDLNSRNGVIVNGELITEKRRLSSQDLIALGTTSFLVIDREEARETIVSPPAAVPVKPEVRKEELAGVEEAAAAEKPPFDWKEIVIPKQHLMWAGVAVFFVLCVIFCSLLLFQAKPVVVAEKDESTQIRELLVKYPDVQFTFNQSLGKLLIVGHVLTPVDHHELIYLLKTLPFIQHIDDTVVVDEYVWQNMNALLATNPDWIGVSIISPAPGRFVMRGYVQTLDQFQALTDYINMNFPYIDRLENQVVVENNLIIEVESMLIEKGYSGVTFELKNGELVLSGRVDSKMMDPFVEVVDHFKTLRGIRQVKNFVIYTTADTSRIDLSSKYHVTGYSKKDDKSFYVVINGKILSSGDTLDGMMITGVLPNMVLLEKDGLKFKINYNQQ